MRIHYNTVACTISILCFTAVDRRVANTEDLLMLGARYVEISDFFRFFVWASVLRLVGF